MSKDAFTVDVRAGQVTCPGQVTVATRPQGDGSAVARFGAACAGCPLRERCTTARDGREVKISPHEEQLARGRERSSDPGWLARYRATRPKVERNQRVPGQRETAACRRSYGRRASGEATWAGVSARVRASCLTSV
ncbi:transposase [Nonomuraea sp. B1E8]|uniref:transposase n=1 Tax=unclassified Nonomuraea TaxID=2593643 RepID=UPI00325E4BA1